MKIYTRFLSALCAVFLLSIVASAPLYAQNAPALAIGIVDMSVILSKAKAYAQLRQEMDKRSQALQADVDKMEQEFTKQRDDLGRQQTLLSPESFKQRQEEFQKKFMTQAQSFDERRAGLRTTSEKATGEIQRKLAEVAASVAQARNMNLVITGTTVLYAIRGFDVTEDVLKQLDEKLPRVTIGK